ncbi:MAG: heme lyase CcmF/NrfE family subunit [Deltaproteobacteria bacterium]|nr:heme lyase CcmF/NrfE family subunit [Deltaproteobacteria bacterium]
MLADYGYYLLLLAFLCSLYGVVTSLLAASLRHRRLFRASVVAAVSGFFLTLGAALLLWAFFFNRDYSLAYVFRNSSNDLPLRYTLSAFWSALEGSHFLWTLLLTLFSLIAHLSFIRDNEHFMPYVSATLHSVLAWMYYLALTYCDPFLVQFPAPQDGLGMNALLQNPYMVFHPPSLFCGYTLSAIPFAYSVAALAYGDITGAWLRTVRNWALLAWSFLTVGVFLGGRWAYVELGWAGYWAWDPVENSSFMPWIFLTALLHSLLVQDKLGQLKRLSLVLSFLAFFFGFFGTFITRSGIISSVHSFAQSPIGPAYLGFLGAMVLFAIFLYGFRAPLILPHRVKKAWGISRESALLLTQFILGTFGVIIVVGTLYPILSELVTGQRFNVQAPYFNTFAPYIGFSSIAAITVGNLLRYQSDKMLGGKKLQFIASLGALLLTFVFSFLADVFRSSGYAFALQLVGIFLCFWGGLCLAYQAWVKARAVRTSVLKQLPYWGSFFAHMGVFVAILGFLGNYRGVDTLVTLKSGEQTQFQGWVFTFPGIAIEQQENAELYNAPLHLAKNGVPMGVISPARAKYPTKPEMLHEVGLRDGFWEDIYIVLSDFAQTGDEATFQIHINPTVKFVWISVFLMVFGGILSLLGHVIYGGRTSWKREEGIPA